VPTSKEREGRGRERKGRGGREEGREGKGCGPPNLQTKLRQWREGKGKG